MISVVINTNERMFYTRRSSACGKFRDQNGIVDDVIEKDGLVIARELELQMYDGFRHGQRQEGNVRDLNDTKQVGSVGSYYSRGRP